MIDTTKTIERLRWRIARLVDKLPGQCWADLVAWVLDGPREAMKADESPLPWRPQTWTCRANFYGDLGSCYCGKLKSDGAV